MGIQFSSPVDIGTIVPSAYGALNTGQFRLSKWRTARARVLAGTGRARILAVGDSTTSGVGGGSTNGLRKYGWPAKAAEILTASGLPATKANVVGTNNQVISNYNTYNPDLVINGSNWVQTGISAGAGGLGNSADTLALNYTPPVPVDTFEVTYLINSGYGILAYNVDGGSSTQINCNGTIAMQKVTIAAGSLGTHTLNLSRVSGGTVLVFAIVAYNSAQPAVDILNAGWGGSTTTDWNDNSNVFRPRKAIQFYAPDLMFINLGINDRTPSYGPIALATYQANLQAIISDNIATSDIVLVVPIPSDAARQTLAIQAQYNQVIYALAQANSLPVIDMVQRWSSFVSSNQFYLGGGDLVHGNALGYADEAWAYSNFLMAA